MNKKINRRDDQKAGVITVSSRNNLAYVQSMCIGRVVFLAGVGIALEIKDRDKRRVQMVGREFVYVPITDLIEVATAVAEAGELDVIELQEKKHKIN